MCGVHLLRDFVYSSVRAVLVEQIVANSEAMCFTPHIWTFPSLFVTRVWTTAAAAAIELNRNFMYVRMFYFYVRSNAFSSRAMMAPVECFFTCEWCELEQIHVNKDEYFFVC